jgi:hypothetical protein
VQPWPEVVRADQVQVKRLHEPFGPLVHVHSLHASELGGDFPARPVEFTVQLVRLGGAADSTAPALALRAAKLDLPGTTTDLVGLDGVNESRIARTAAPRTGPALCRPNPTLPSAGHEAPATTEAADDFIEAAAVGGMAR